MQLKHILCTLFALGIVGAAHAADDIITGGDGTCNETVLGTSENLAQVDTIATWSLNEYDCPAGQYLLVDGDNIACTPCASGSYCPGGIFTVESENKGTNICPTDYTSDEGTKSESACYTQCELSCFQTACPQNASGECVYGNASVPGQEFYGLQGVCMTEGARFCSIDFSCKSGYTKQTTTWAEMRNQMGQLYEKVEDGMRYCDGVSGSSFSHDCSTADKNELMIKVFDPETKTFYVESVEAVHFDVSSLIGYVTELGLQVNSNGIMVPSELGLESTRYFNAYAYRPYRIAKITEQELLEYANKHNMTFDAVIDGINNDTVDIRSMAAKLPDNLPWIVIPDSDIDWQSGETYDAFNNSFDGLGMIIYALVAMVDVPGSGYPDIASMAYGEIPYSSCVVNKINIDWNPDDGSENIAGMCLYGGDVNIPEYVPTKPGYTFKGWKLVTE